jgi:ATP-binding protein involved in chromosome partitioning
MINKLNLPISGLIENMSWFQPDETDKKYYLFGRDGGKELSEEYSLDLLAQLPLVELTDDANIQNNPTLKKEFVNISDKLTESIKNLKEKKSAGIPQINIIQ